ncbi:MAG TPA: hypothetical protein VF167_16015 [Longimicrobiaceae bacterium]
MPNGRCLLLWLFILFVGCIREPAPAPAVEAVGPPDPADVESVIFLVGDGGDATAATHPILPRLHQDIEWWAGALERDSSVYVLFLGDIVYPEGLHDQGTGEWPRDSTVVMDQVLLLAGPQARLRGARGYFLAGNHDWGMDTNLVGARTVALLSNFLVMAGRHTGANVALEPPAGTGGPTVVDVGSHIRMLLLDTAWWLLYGNEDDAFRNRAVLEGIEEAMQTAGEREILIAAHHPFKSAGPHGGHFSFWETFGLRYILARSGAILQDLTSLPYRELERGLRQIFARLEPPLIFAGGHEHSLQVIHGTEATDPVFNLVSGAASKNSEVGEAPGKQFGVSAPGYQKLVIFEDGSIHLYVEAAPPEYLSCPSSSAVSNPESSPEGQACMAEGLAAFQTVHSQRLR